MSSPKPDKIMQIATGHWASQILNCALDCELFNHLEKSGATVGELAQRASISERGARALLDGTFGLGLVTKEGDSYHNSEEASMFLVKGQPRFLGFAAIADMDWPAWGDLKTAVKNGTMPEQANSYEVENFEFWERLVTAIAPLSFPIAEAAAEHLGVAQRGPFHMLDVGGGSGIYSAVWLGKNGEGRATQLDWPNVNQVARNFVNKFGVGDRFTTRDGNCLEVDFGDKQYDFGIYSHMAHGLSVAQNQNLLGKFRKALKPDGTLVIADFILDDDRRGHPMSLMFTANMLHATEAGSTYTKGEYEEWLRAAGFSGVEIQAFPPGPVSVAYAR